MHVFFSCKASVPVHENFILIAYPININNITSHDKDVVSYIQLGYIKLGVIFGLSLHLNPHVLCAM